MKKSLHIFSNKKPCRIQIVFGLCLAMLFTFISNINVVYALDEYDENLYPVKTSKILSEDLTASKNIGLADSNFSIFQSNILDLNYYDYVMDCVDNALTHVDSYFDSDVSFNSNYRSILNALYTLDDGSFIDREWFLNAYLCLDSNLSGYVYFQLCYGYNGINDSTVSGSNIDGYYQAQYRLNSSPTFAYYLLNNNDEKLKDLIMVPTSRFFDFGPFYSGNLSPITFDSNQFVNFSNLVSSLNNDPYYYSYSFFRFYRNYGTNIQVYADSVLNFEYILPLYIDSSIYFPLSFISEYNNTSLHGDFVVSGDYASFIYTPAVPYSSDVTGFDPSFWFAGEFQSGILGNSVPDPIITPIPTFSPIYTPTPFPTLNIRATLTPIAIPNDPLINTGLGDPISVVYGVIGYLTQVLSLPHIKFISTTIEYVYNSNIFFQILMFLIPGIVLITFMIGRLKRK